jgi:uncharacterized SAM-binding protein YcdF (DUF218 family)
MKVLIAVLAVVLLWLGGLIAFVVTVQHEHAPDPAPQVDGVVALTGASNARITEAMALLERGKAREVLVSGVNRDVTREQLRQAAGAPPGLYDCCVELGYEAEDTIGNAREIADWVRRKDFRSLIVVTSDYHMPRSLIEIHSQLPGVKLVAYPVATPSLDGPRWWRSALGARRLTVEYCKFLVVATREGLISLWKGLSGGGKPPAAHRAASGSQPVS